ncbi:centrin [Plasmodium gonderi]|uniref:Centrin n=1 Tax=Plasmodium gonderi TaxID=77519 RepID=A0A1Y1JB01_PLAGO|nr:centrin [Plasmodium gonderi]GAW78868.1 centrin [Plasmodium gonderi]
MRLSCLKLILITFVFTTFWNKLKSQKNNGTESLNQVPTDMSEEEKENIYEEFVDYDLNRDGLIDAEEISIVLKNMKKPDFIKFFTKVDLDSSGTISINEYMIFISSN